LVEVVWLCPNETFRNTSVLWSSKSRYQCDKRKRKTEVDMREAVKRDLKGWDIPRDLCLDRSA
jgi:hypothetical protein